MFITSIKAVLARLILTVHAFIAVWRTTVSESDQSYWLFLLMLLGVLADLAFILIKRKGKEWKWFSPTIFFYLATTIPCIWLMQLKRLGDKLQAKDLISANMTELVEKSHSDSNISPHLEEITKRLSSVTSQLQLDADQWVSFIEQAMLLIIIIARWMLPVSKHISRDQLSQLLLVYLGLAADIIELFAIFDEPKVLDHKYFILAVLGFWSWSLMQFTFFLTATRARGFSTSSSPAVADEQNAPASCCFFCDGEIWSILIMCCMLDLPFLSLRLTAMIYYRINTYTIYFFTCKNILVVLLQSYRLCIVCHKQYKEHDGTDDQRHSGSPRRQVSPMKEGSNSHSVEMDGKDK